MTVSTATARVVYNGDGSTVVFPVPFRFLDNSHVAVFLRNVVPKQAGWVEGTQYNLTGAGNNAGGVLTVKTSPVDYTPQVGEQLIILRSVPITQETDYVENDDLPSSTIENDFDKRVMVSQQLDETLGRALVAPEADTLAGNLELPLDADRAEKFLAFDSLGNAIASIGTAAGQPVPFSTFGQSWVTLADAVAARAFLVDAPVKDPNGNELLAFVTTPVAVNEVTLANAATGNSPKLSATGDDANIGIDWQVKGAGAFQFLDGSGNEILKTAAGAASAINELTVANAAAGNAPTISATGDDTNIDVAVTPKGTGGLNVAGPVKRAGNVLSHEVLQSGTASNQLTLDILNLPPGFRRFDLVYDNLLPATNSVDLRSRVRQQGQGSFDAGASDYDSIVGVIQVGSSATGIGTLPTLDHMKISGVGASVLGNGAGQQGAGTISIYGARDIGQKTRLCWDITSVRDNASLMREWGAAWRNVVQDDDAIQLYFSAGNISTMNWTLIGVRA